MSAAAAAVTAAQRGHRVTLFESRSTIGGQFDLARRIPGKEEFAQTLRYYARQVEVTGVTLKLNHKVTRDELAAGEYTLKQMETGDQRRVNRAEIAATVRGNG